MLPSPLLAAFVVFDDFNSYTAGSLNSQGGWVSPAGWTVTTSPLGGVGNVISGASSTGSTSAYRPLALGINDASTAATIFFRLYRTGAVNISAGLSDEAAPALFGGYETQVNAQHNTAQTDTFKVRDGGAFDDLGAGTFALDTWYNVWMVINNFANTYEVWLDQGVYGTPGSALTHVADPNGGAGDFTFGFRNGAAANPLTTVIFAIGGATPVLNGSLVVDDVYVDTDAQNLNNPTIPEPASGLLVGSTIAVGCACRRRRS